MNILHQLINHAKKNFPEQLTTNHLIDFGIFKSHQAARAARKKNKGPPYFQFERTIIYPKDGVIAYLEQCAHEGSI